mgnify:CR=1 FL=1
MSILTKYREWRERRKVVSLFSAMVSPEVLKQMEENPVKYSLGLKEGPIEFVLIKVHGDPINNLPEKMSGVIDVCFRQNEIYISHIISNIIYGFYFFWQHKNISDIPQKRRVVVSELMNKYSSEIAIVHGTRHGYCGNFGSKQKMQYTAVFEDFNEALRKIIDIPLGKEIEI